MDLAKKIAAGMLLKVTLAAGSADGVEGLQQSVGAIAAALRSPECRVQTFDFGGNGGLTEALLPAMVTVKRTDLRGCSGLTTLPEGLGQCTKLTSLNLWGCSGLTTLPEGLGQCTQLTTLDLRGCMGLATLPDLSALHPTLQVDASSASAAVAAWVARGCTAAP